jgi:uncharacterized protein (TIGR03086 family)
VTPADRFRRLAAAFTDRVEGTTDWGAPAPCEGWVARDVVDHLTSWVPGFFDGALDLPVATGDPVADWAALRDAVQAALDDEAVSAREVTSRAGTHPVGVAVDQFVTGDVLVHTWDLARATGQDERLDEVEVHRMLEGMLPMDEVLRSSGHYGPRVEVPDDADEQTRLIAFTGRQP